MSKLELFTVVLTLVGGFFVFFLIGSNYGERYKQTTIVEECKNTGMYLDRNLLMVCQVGTPVVVPKPESL